ncbi:MAG TPA: polymer-forming cytoskeletal protein [Pelolinea sp.]|nr:polymer-forming cytoskeletal protein [Pelolinea sp.]
MFKRSSNSSDQPASQVERVTSVLGDGINWTGKLSGKGGVRIEGIFEGEIAIGGLVVVGETGKVTCENVRANTVIVAGAVHGGITAGKLEIRSTGRVWGNVKVSAFSTEEGAFLRGQVTMEDNLDLGLSDTGETKVTPDPETSKNTKSS